MAYFPNFPPTSLDVFFFIIFIEAIVKEYIHVKMTNTPVIVMTDTTQLFIFIENNLVKIIVY